MPLLLIPYNNPEGGPVFPWKGPFIAKSTSISTTGSSSLKQTTGSSSLKQTTGSSSSEPSS